MKILTGRNVFDEALVRMNFIFDEFENIFVNVSGGKDSTVVLNLALKVAEERGRLPLNVLFVDQEAEWDSVITHVREVMNDPRVKPYWLQIPIKLFNATSQSEPWLYCWAEGEEWIRPKEPNAITENVYGTDRFKDLFDAFFAYHFPNEKAVHIGGVRCEESPRRMLGLTTYACYKWATWGRALDKKRGHVNLYPIYDWSYTDVWKAIHDNGWPYCPLYDAMYQYGVGINQMRVSNVHHETAISTLFYLQEIEADTWNRVTKRISGINTAGKLGAEDYYIKGRLPFMFSSWKEYRDYLVDNLISDPEKQQIFRARFARMDVDYDGMIGIEAMHKAQINTLMANDFEMTKMENWEHIAAFRQFYNWKKTGVIDYRLDPAARRIPK